ncbi:DNA-processing protein DprA [Nocardioides sp.]|uniref:DNA-processing protein DprA n=1 Tax=Nocardioides sp. TaxID=35761 RepID=UPI0039E3C227
MSDDAERLARLTLNLVFEPGDPRAWTLVDELGAEELLARLRADREAAEVVTAAGPRLATVRPERVLAGAAKLGIRFVVPGDGEWPAGLDDLRGAGSLAERSGPPFGLWVRGAPLDRLDRVVAVVGSRAATQYGVDTAAGIAAEVARVGWVVVSGGAYGIDQAAHRGALAVRGLTIAVLANGLDRCYPPGSNALMDAIAEDGAVVSELAPGCAPSRIRFLARNRLIAALARGTVVVEAASRSGALNTANWTGRLHRPVLGVPGPVTSARSEGVHELVRSGAAGLVTSGEEVLEAVARPGEHLITPKRAPQRRRDRLTIRQQQVLDAVPIGVPAPTGDIARTAGLGIVETRRGLDQLEQAGLVVYLDTGWRLTPLARAG